MRKDQRKELLELIIFCDTNNFNVQSYGWSKISAIKEAKVIDEDGATFTCRYSPINGWVIPPQMSESYAIESNDANTGSAL